MKCKYFYLTIIFIFVINAISAQNNVKSDRQSCKVGGVNIFVPSPNDDLIEIGFDNREKMEIFVPTENRLICSFLSKSDNNALTEGGDMVMTTYAFVEVPRRGEYVNCSQDDFQEVIKGAKESFGDKIASSFKESEDEINRRMKALDLTSIQIGDTKQLGPLFSKKDVFSFGMLTSVKNEIRSCNLIISGIVLRVKSKLLFLYLYTEYKNEESIKWIGTTSEKWTDLFFKANR